MRSKAILVLAAVVVSFAISNSAVGGYLYGTSYLNLYQIDPTDGSFTGIADGSGFISCDGLASVPEPSTLLLLGLGVAMLRRKR